MVRREANGKPTPKGGKPNVARCAPMGSRRTFCLVLLVLAGCARLIGLDELRGDPEGPLTTTDTLSPDAAAPSAAGSGGAGAVPANAGQLGLGGVGGSSEGSDESSLGGTAGEGAGAGGTTGSSGSAGAAGASSVAGTSSGVDGGSGAAGASSAAGASGGVVGSGCPGNLLVNGGFEAGSDPWVSYTNGMDALIYDSTDELYEGVTPHGGQHLGWLGGVPSETNRLSQTVIVPAAATQLALEGSVRVQIFEEHQNVDYLRIRLVMATATVVLEQLTNADAGSDWVPLVTAPVALTPSAQPLAATLEFESELSAGPGTNFFLDDLALVATCPQ